MIQQAVQLPGIVQVGVNGFLVRVRLHKIGIIRHWFFIDKDIFEKSRFTIDHGEQEVILNKLWEELKAGR